jgi:ATP-dependent Lhr-like helicase
VLLRLTEAGRLMEGEFRPGGTEREWVDADVLRSLRRRSLARLRQEIEPVDADALGRFRVAWHGIGSGRHGLEALLDAIEQLQGASVPASALEREILPARVEDYHPAMLDTLMAAGEVVWVGVEPLGERDGRIALYLTDHVARLRPPATAPPAVEGRAAEILEYLAGNGASFFAAIHQGTGQGFPQETVDALWDLVWAGLVTNDTLHPLRAYVRVEDKRGARRRPPSPFRSRRLVPRTAEGRWSVVETASLAETTSARRRTPVPATEWAAAMAQQLLTRHGVVTRETVASEAVAGGFSAVYDVLKAMEEAGRIRRGYFVAGLGGAQFAMPPALDLLRSLREVPEEPRTVVLAATDPANPYGAIVKWPEVGGSTKQDPTYTDPVPSTGRRPTRTVGALAILVDGFAAAYVRRGEREVLLFAPDDEPQRSRLVREVARMLLQLAASREVGLRGMLIGEINGMPASAHPAARLFIEEGFATTAMGLQARLEHGTLIAGRSRGGIPMADAKRNTTQPKSNETRDTEQDRVRSSNDRDQSAEREGLETEHNRGYDNAVRGQRSQEDKNVEDIDPDSAESDVDRDDTIDEP